MVSLTHLCSLKGNSFEPHCGSVIYSCASAVLSVISLGDVLASQVGCTFSDSRDYDLFLCIYRPDRLSSPKFAE